MLALAAGGWGSVVAAVFCPHANGFAAKAFTADSVADEPACHTAKPAAKPDCHDSTMEQGAMGDMKQAHAVHRGSGSSATFGLKDGESCAHCMGRPQLPTSNVIARRQAEPRRNVEPAIIQAAPLAAAPNSFTQPVVYRQGAPPGSLIPKHLLIGVLLI